LIPNDPHPCDPSRSDLTRLEERLAQLRPSEPSPQFLRRLDAARAASADRARWAPRRRRTAALIVAAVLLAVTLLVRIGGRSGKPAPIPVAAGPVDKLQPGGAASVDDAPRFTLLSYRRALARSQDDFNALLARDSVVTDSPSSILAFEHPGPGVLPGEGDD
jgi:hypothetical protein